MVDTAADKMLQFLLAQLKTLVPYVQGYVTTLGGRERASIMLTISFDAKADWKNGILENSRYARFSIDSPGSIELFSGYGTAKFRKTPASTDQVVLAKLSAWIAATKALTPMEAYSLQISQDIQENC